MIFCAANEPSIGFVRETLLNFRELLGLVVFLGRILFLAGADSEFPT